MHSLSRWTVKKLPFQPRTAPTFFLKCKPCCWKVLWVTILGFSSTGYSVLGPNLQSLDWINSKSSQKNLINWDFQRKRLIRRDSRNKHIAQTELNSVLPPHLLEQVSKVGGWNSHADDSRNPYCSSHPQDFWLTSFSTNRGATCILLHVKSRTQKDGYQGDFQCELFPLEQMVSMLQFTPPTQRGTTVQTPNHLKWRLGSSLQPEEIQPGTLMLILPSFASKVSDNVLTPKHVQWHF